MSKCKPHRTSRIAGALPHEALASLYGAFAALARARSARGALELDIGEDRVVLDADRRPIAIMRAVRLDSHRLIEEFMILANVAAAEELEARRLPCMYRVHDAPDPEKMAALAGFSCRDRHSGPRAGEGTSAKTRALQSPIARVSRADRKRLSSMIWSFGARRKPPTAPTISAISGWLCGATPILPRRSAAMPTSWSIER